MQRKDLILEISGNQGGRGGYNVHIGEGDDIDPLQIRETGGGGGCKEGIEGGVQSGFHIM